MTEINDFIRWARKNSLYRGIICHFYMPEKLKPYYGKVDFAYFNLSSQSEDWIVRGTPGHGIKSKRGKRSKVPCLNCFEVDESFYKAIKELIHEDDHRFEMGILLNKRKLKNEFELIDVSTERPKILPPPFECHHYDNPYSRPGVLRPFNFCKVVRAEIPDGYMGLPIAPIRGDAVMGLLVREGNKRNIDKMLKSKGMTDVRVFPVL